MYRYKARRSPPGLIPPRRNARKHSTAPAPSTRTRHHDEPAGVVHALDAVSEFLTVETLPPPSRGRTPHHPRLPVHVLEHADHGQAVRLLQCLLRQGYGPVQQGRLGVRQARSEREGMGRGA